MITNKKGILISSILIFGLVGCTQANQSLNRDQFGTKTTNRNINNNRALNVRYDNLDQTGPLTDRYNVGVDNRHKVNNNLNISADRTSMSSGQYPHTEAILTQSAKYKFRTIDPSQAIQQQAGAPQFTQPFVQQQIPGGAQQFNVPAQPQGQPRKNTTTNQPAKNQPTNNQPTGNISQVAQQVINLTNNERAKNGLPALKVDTKLSGVAQKKSADMQQNHYFSHTSPTYGSPFDMMRDFGVSYKSAGENIAMGQRTAQEVVNSWMNSQGHRENILNKSFTHIGVGVEQTGYHWSQMFISK
ncbi:CAP domain-containing protein [Heyndrickxia sp. NPDC080065]|uniref:CAP domain-containing protein n=1 Tax=Heyndrickxia sp. NPDC080065 TaxID=3390568 RepID=UPI003CFEA38D